MYVVPCNTRVTSTQSDYELAAYDRGPDEIVLSSGGAKMSLTVAAAWDLREAIRLVLSGTLAERRPPDPQAEP